MTNGDKVSTIAIDIAGILNRIKEYRAGYSNSKSGKIIINKDGQNFLLSIEPIETKEDTLESAIKEYRYLIKEDLE